MIMEPHRGSPQNPLYPSIDQYPTAGMAHNQDAPNAYNNYGNYPAQNGGFHGVGAFAQPNQQGKLPFDDLGLISGMAFGPVGTSMLRNANQYVGSTFGRYMTLSPLKYYFNVNNSYVFNKIKLLLCPFIHKSWKRRIGRYNEVDSYVPPREDINAPDLYIPVMAFVTYVLVVGFVLGTSLKFTPEVLGGTATTGLVVLAFEVMMIKAGFYLLNCGNISVYDLTAYCGYKFVVIVVNIFVGILSSAVLFHSITLYTGICMAIFMVRTLRIVLTLEQGGFGGSPGGFIGSNNGNTGGIVGAADISMSRNYFLLIVAFLQVLLVYFLGVTP